VSQRVNQQAVSWTSIFTSQILQRFSSNFTAVVNSTLYTTTSSILKRLLTKGSTVMHHRETRRTYFSRERLFSQSSERQSSVARVHLIQGPLTRHDDDPASRPGPPSFPRADRSLAFKARSNFRITRVSNTITNHAHHSASSFIVNVSPTVSPRETTPLASRESVGSPRMIYRTDLVWRQPAAAANVESQEVRRSSLEKPSRSRVLTFDPQAVNKTTAKATLPSAVPAFDAAQMDRFADNIIGRVEKRMRIERERRGW